jgi:hypothetical protein
MKRILEGYLKLPVYHVSAYNTRGYDARFKLYVAGFSEPAEMGRIMPIDAEPPAAIKIRAYPPVELEVIVSGAILDYHNPGMPHNWWNMTDQDIEKHNQELQRRHNEIMRLFAIRVLDLWAIAIYEKTGVHPLMT